MALAVLALLFSLVAAGSFGLVLLHAFRRSLGTAVMVLLLPFYSFYYGFSQFEHRLKGAVLAGWLSGLMMAIVLRLVSLRVV